MTTKQTSQVEDISFTNMTGTNELACVGCGMLHYAPKKNNPGNVGRTGGFDKAQAKTLHRI